MTNTSVTKIFGAISLFALAVLLFSVAFVRIVRADDYSYDGGGGDAYSYDGGSSYGGDTYSYDGSAGYSYPSDSYSYDGSAGYSYPSDTYSYDGSSSAGTGDTYSYDGSTGYTGDTYSYDGSTGNTYEFNPCTTSCGGNTYEYGAPCDTSCGGNTYEYGSAGNTYEYGCSTCVTENGVSYSTEYGSGTSYSTQYTPGYMSQSCVTCSRPFSIPTPTSFPIPPSYFPQPFPQPIPTPIPQPFPQPIPQPIVIPQQPSVITNNTCTNGSCSYANNSVNNSGNTVTVLPVTQAPASYPIQYTFPPAQNLTCTIAASPNQVQAGQYAYLQWQSNGAVSATLSGYGNVAPSGSLSLRPTGSQNYILTVYGQNGQTTTCNTFVTIGQVTHYPSVTLSQIPYTGFDFGTVGDTLYWIALAIFALASGYLLVYYRGGMAAFAALAPRRAPVAIAPAAQPLIAAAPVAPKAEVVAKPAALVLPTLAARTRPTNDSMQVATTADGTPRIVISRN